MRCNNTRDSLHFESCTLKRYTLKLLWFCGAEIAGCLV